MTTRFTGSARTLRDMAKVRNQEYIGNSFFQKLLGIQELMASKVESLEVLYDTRKDRSEVSEILRAAEKLKNELPKIERDFLLSSAETELALEAALYEHSGLQRNEFDSEIRTVLRAMSGSDRSAFIGRALESRDKKILSAILPENVPSALSGISFEMQTQYRETFFGIVCPSLMETRAAFRDLHSNVDTTYGVLKEATNFYLNDKKLAELNKEQIRNKQAKTTLDAL